MMKPVLKVIPCENVYLLSMVPWATAKKALSMCAGAPVPVWVPSQCPLARDNEMIPGRWHLPYS